SSVALGVARRTGFICAVAVLEGVSRISVWGNWSPLEVTCHDSKSSIALCHAVQENDSAIMICEAIDWLNVQAVDASCSLLQTEFHLVLSARRKALVAVPSAPPLPSTSCAFPRPPFFSQ